MSSQPNPALAVRCRDLHKAYRVGEARVEALRGVELAVHAGELFLLAGPSGCGKTTLISILGAILSPDRGRCEVFGQDPNAMDERQRVHFRGATVGFVFQAFNLLPALSAQQNVAVPLLLNRVPRARAMARAQELLAAVGLGGREQALPGQLSGGQQQRVAVARALVHEPRLIVCDEPTSNLDHETGLEVMGLLRQVARNPQRALVVVSHDPRILGFADRIGHMDDGRITDITAGEAGEQL